jgi:hypothetical protein
MNMDGDYWHEPTMLNPMLAKLPSRSTILEDKRTISDRNQTYDNEKNGACIINPRTGDYFHSSTNLISINDILLLDFYELRNCSCPEGACWSERCSRHKLSHLSPQVAQTN